MGMFIREKCLVAITGLVIIISIIIYCFWYQPVSRQLTEIEKEIGAYKAKLITYQKNGEDRKEEMQLQELLEKQEKQAKQVPDIPAVPELLAQLSNWTEQAEVIMVYFGIDKEERDSDYTILFFRMQVIGEFENILKFLRKMENAERLIHITEVNLKGEGITRTAGDGKKGEDIKTNLDSKLQAKIRFSIFTDTRIEIAR